MDYLHDLRAELEKRLADMEVAIEEEGVDQYHVLRAALIVGIGVIRITIVTDH